MAPPAASPAPVDIASAFIPPAQLIKAVENAGVAKANTPVVKQFLLGILAGVFIALGGMVSISFAKGLPNSDPGMVKFLFGAVFPVGLILVIVCGSELITGNFAVLVPGALNNRYPWYRLLINWVTVYCGNFVGSIAVALFWAFYTDLYAKDPWLAGVQGIAEGKVSKGFGTMFLSATGCNFLVTLAVFMAIAGKTLMCKVAVIWFPIQTFVTIGFEHCVANMFLVPVGMLYGANVTVGAFLFKNLLPVTLGNMFSAILFTGGMYWYIYGMPAGWPLTAFKKKEAEKEAPIAMKEATPKVVEEQNVAPKQQQAPEKKVYEQGSSSGSSSYSSSYTGSSTGTGSSA